MRALPLLSLVVALGIGPGLAQDTKERSGRILKGKLVASGAGSLMVTPAGGAPLKVSVTSKSVFHPAQGEPKLTSFKPKQEVVGEFELVQGKWTLRELWDSAAWTAHLAQYEGVKSGAITRLTAHTLEVGELRYSLTKETAWLKKGAKVERKSFKGGETVFVTASTSKGIPVATRVSDQEGN